LDNIFSPEITKEYVLLRLTQEEVFERYMGGQINLSDFFCSPLRDDKNPTCKFKWYNGKLRFKDFSGHFEGDCFDFVMKMFGCSFHESLDVVASDFNLSSKKITYPEYKIESLNKERGKKLLQVQWKPFTEADMDYWASQGVTIDELNLFNVGSVKTVWLDGVIVYSGSELCYGYWFENDEMKIYFPQRIDFRFLCNTNVIQGYSQLPDTGDTLIITKSLKDVMTLNRFGYNAIAFQSEHQIPTDEQYLEFSERFETIYSLYDFDYAGICSANEMRHQYGIQPIFLTNGRFHTINRKAKDISDLFDLGGNSLVSRTIKEFEYERDRM